VVILPNINNRLKLNYERYIAANILRGKSGKRRFSNPVIRISIAGIALGVAVMIVAVMVVTGFRNEITQKVIGFGAHIRINNFDANNSFEESPISIKAPFVAELKENPEIKKVQEYATKAGIIKTSEEIEGIVLKGVSQNYDWDFFKNKIISGRIIGQSKASGSSEVMVSKKTADKLTLKPGDEIIIYFIEQPPRIRKLKISGIYETGLNEFDNIYAFCDINLIRKLNNWEPDQAGGIELLVNDFSRLNEIDEQVYQTAGFQYYTQSIKEQYPQIFHWLDLQNINVAIIITLILLVAGISMIATLLIIILENANLIGILKTLGATDVSVRKIFIYIALPVIGLGILAGNVLGIVLCLLQMNFGFITLPQESYYVATVPINFSLLNLLLINAGTILACVAMLIGPSVVISRIVPSKVIRFD